MTTTDPQYFAVIDPLDPERFTYWCRRGAELKPWPTTARYHVLQTRDLPAGLTRRAELDYVQAHYAQVWQARDEIASVIASDPDTAAARFASLNCRCCICARPLTDARSKVYGIGPDCRAALSPEVLDVFAERIARTHARHEATTT